jgi:hypothetical protein
MNLVTLESNGRLLMKTATFQVGEFSVAVSFYTRNLLIIIHNSIPGVGNIFYTEREDGIVSVDQLLGTSDEMLSLLASRLADHFSVPNVTFIMSFHPSKLQTFDSVKSFIAGFSGAFQALSAE